MDILGLLKRIEWGSEDVCPDCDTWKYNSTSGDVNQHDKDCHLKAAIDGLEAGRLVVMLKTKCLWAEDIDGNWDTSCGEKFTVTEGCPSENNMKFCAYCSKELIEKMFCFNDETKEQGT